MQDNRKTMKPEEFKAKVKRGRLDIKGHKEQYIVCINCHHVYKKTNSFKYRTLNLTQEIQNEKLDEEQLPDNNILTVRQEPFGNQDIISRKSDKRYRNICSRECAAQLTEEDPLITCDNKQCSNILPYNQMVEKRLTDNNYTLLKNHTQQADIHIAKDTDIDIVVIENKTNDKDSKPVKKPDYEMYCSDKCATADAL